MSGSPNAFDTLAQALMEDSVSNGFRCEQSDIGGKPGARKIQFYVDGIDQDMGNDEAWIAEQLALVFEENHIGYADILVDKVERNDDDNNRTILVAHLDDDPALTWGVLVESVVPHDDDHPTSANVTVLENGEQIRKYVLQEKQESIDALAEDIVERLHAISPGDPMVQLALLKAINELTDGRKIVDTWNTAFTQQTLEEQTQPAPKSAAGGMRL